MHTRARIAVVVAAASVACREPTPPVGSGGVALSVVAGTSACGPLNSARVQVQGPTRLTTSIGIGETKTITGLAPGSYTVGLEGLVGSDVDCFGQASNVQVVAGPER